MEFQGFQNTLPLIFKVLVIIALLGLSWWSYRKVKSIPPLPRWLLILLRGSTLVIVFLLLLNPFFYSSREIEVGPEIAVFLDNSESVSITKGNYKGEETYGDVREELAFEEKHNLNISYYSIGNDTRPFSPESLNFTENQTNISKAIETILAQEEQVRAAVLLSDGIFTYGKDPVFSASNSSIPIYTIALGDTSNVRDISVSNILSNTTGYTNTSHLAEAEISQSGFKNSTVQVSLFSGDSLLKEKPVTFTTDNQVVEVKFEIELSEPGLQQFQIQTEAIEGEWSTSNNDGFFSVEVLDSKVKILHIAFEVHPDVKTVRSLIAGDVNNQLSTLTWLVGSRFIEEIPREEDFNLLVIHGTPPSNTGFSFLEELSGIPTIFLSLPSTVQNPTSELFSEAKLIKNNSSQVSPVSLKPLLNKDEQPIMELPEVDHGLLPTLQAPLRSELIEVRATPLFASVIEQIETNSPVLTVLEEGNLRRTHINAWNWFRISQSPDPLHREFVTRLFGNALSWTSSDPDTRKLQIKPAKRTFSTSESPSINASLQNESGNRESEAIIELRVSSDGEDPRSFNMDNLGNGNYELELPRLSEGLYDYEAIARKGNREIDRQQGEFLVSNSNNELTNTRRNDALLQSMARSTGGDYFTFSEVSAFWDSLETDGVLDNQTRTIENYQFPVRSIFWFVIVVVLLATEWILRKYYSLP